MLTAMDENEVISGIRIHIDSSNSDMVEDPFHAIQDALLKVLERLRNGASGGDIRDTNGNIIGEWNAIVSEKGE